VTWKPGYNSGIAAADMATIANAIKRQGVVNPNGKPLIEFGNFSYNGQLFLPGNRGVIQLKFGDVVAVDTNWGWPIVISNEALAAASSPWVFV
jgi:hypothetical protein